MGLVRVVVLLQEPAAPFEVGVVHEVFGIDRTNVGVPGFDFVCATEFPDAPLSTGGSLRYTANHGLEALAHADLVVVPSAPVTGASPAVLESVADSHGSGAIVLGTCTGVFTFAEAGLLDGQIAAVHWRHASQLADAYPAVAVDTSSLYRIENRVVTSAGTAAGIDACLQLVRQYHGSIPANRIARRMVTPPHRDGGQLQYLEHPVPPGSNGGLQPLLRWIEDHLDQPHTLASLAAQHHTSTRTLTRHFHDQLGTTPVGWITLRRVVRAQELLEATDAPIDTVARHLGFGSADLLRHHFRLVTGTGPSAYRKLFRQNIAGTR